MADIIAALRARRLELGLSQSDLARQLHLSVSANAVSKMENPETTGHAPTLNTLRRWAEALGMELQVVPKLPATWLLPHGTRAAAERHRYHHESLCEPCRKADRLYERLRKRDQRAKVTA